MKNLASSHEIIIQPWNKNIKSLRRLLRSLLLRRLLVMLLQYTWPQQSILLAVDTHVLDDRDESAVVLLGVADAGAENLEQIAAENTLRWDRRVNFGRGWEVGWWRGRRGGRWLLRSGGRGSLLLS